jgi:membrane protease YdiL (CAAX protease family)
MTGPPDTAQRLRQFGPLGVVAMLAIFASSVLGFIVTAILVFVWAHHSNTPLRALGFKTPAHPAATLLAGLALGVILKLALKSIAMPLLGAPAINQTYHYVVGNAAALPLLIGTVLISAAFGEEVFFRGYLFERLGALLGASRAALFATVLVTSGLFALAHYQDQGLPGVEQASMTGLVLGGIYAWRKEIWLPMIVHAAYDLAAILLIYMGWEEAVARLIFPGR